MLYTVLCFDGARGNVGGVWYGMVWHGSQDTHIAYRPYFFNPFNLLDLGMIGVFIALIAVHIRVQVEAQRVDWENLSTFVNTYVSWC